MQIDKHMRIALGLSLAGLVSIVLLGCFSRTVTYYGEFDYSTLTFSDTIEKKTARERNCYYRVEEMGARRKITLINTNAFNQEFIFERDSGVSYALRRERTVHAISGYFTRGWIHLRGQVYYISCDDFKVRSKNVSWSEFKDLNIWRVVKPVKCKGDTLIYEELTFKTGENKVGLLVYATWDSLRSRATFASITKVYLRGKEIVKNEFIVKQEPGRDSVIQTYRTEKSLSVESRMDREIFWSEFYIDMNSWIEKRER